MGETVLFSLRGAALKQSKFATRDGLVMLLGATLTLRDAMDHLVWRRADQPLKRVAGSRPGTRLCAVAGDEDLFLTGSSCGSVWPSR